MNTIIPFRQGRDLLIAGYKVQIEGSRTVTDLIPHRGPLSGIRTGTPDRFPIVVQMYSRSKSFIPPPPF